MDMDGSEDGNIICDHEVGTGKTLIMCIAAHEMKRLGLAHKPMIIGLKANVAEIAVTYMAAYPNARILYASEKDFSTANRIKFFNTIKKGATRLTSVSGRVPRFRLCDYVARPVRQDSSVTGVAAGNPTG